MTEPNEPFYYRPSAPGDRSKPESVQADVCIYGGNAAAIIAAVQLRMLGRSVVVVAPERRIGGLTTGGLSYTDFGNKSAVGGLSREFYRRIGQRYGVGEEWKFEPHVAEMVLLQFAAEHQVPVRFREFLQSVEAENGRVTRLTTENNLSVAAKIFFDCTYEGDLMARAKVTHTVGREANSVYEETYNGVQVRDKHQFKQDVDPYVVAGDPKSGLLPGIDASPLPANGSGDTRLQAYNFRLCLTSNEKNRLPIERPQGYDRAQYELLARSLAAGFDEVFRKFDGIRGDKVDVNNNGGISTDFIGQNYDWPTADYATRETIFQRHVTYTRGWLYFLATDAAVPAAIREKMGQWGFCRDEFQDTGGFSRQLYIREARRLVSDYVMTDNDCTGKRACDDSIGMGAYGMDSHNCRRFVDERGFVRNEGDVQIRVHPYPISYRSVVPKRGDVKNLFVPICLSSSHIAYGSIRMEPVFLVLAQSAAIAADLCLEKNVATQDVPYADLQARLLAAGQVLTLPKPAPDAPIGSGNE